MGVLVPPWRQSSHTKEDRAPPHHHGAAKRHRGGSGCGHGGGSRRSSSSAALHLHPRAAPLVLSTVGVGDGLHFDAVTQLYCFWGGEELVC